MTQTTAKTHLTTPFRTSLELHRYPQRKNELLQAWDAADELLLEHLAQRDLRKKRVLIINDSFGALSCVLSSVQGLEITTYTDSSVSARGAEENRKRNGIIGPVRRIHNLQDLLGSYDFALIKLPNQLSFLEDILCHLSHHLRADSQTICAAMIKHLPKAAFELLQKTIGETSTSLAEKKARLIFAKLQRPPCQSPYPVEVQMESPFEKTFTHPSHLFSREKLDIGTRFFVEHLPKSDFKTLLDLGCANGIIGIRAKQLNPQANVHFSDDSWMAVQSARENFEKHFPGQNSAHFHWTNCFEGQERDFLDLVLCNPPFHQQTTVGDFIAWQMFTDAHRSLKKSGLLRVIGNSHLRYDVKLKKIFGNSRIIATNRKFTIIDSVK